MYFFFLFLFFSPDPAAAQQAVRPRRPLRSEEQEAAAEVAEEHGGARRGPGAPADPIREGNLWKKNEGSAERQPREHQTTVFLFQGEDLRMQDIMKLAHQFLQNFCAGNQQNQALLHKHINLFLNPGVSSSYQPTRRQSDNIAVQFETLIA